MSSPINRRTLLKTSTLAAAGTIAIPAVADRPIPADLVPATQPAGFQLGLVTYNIAGEWDIATIIERCTTLGIGAVELRTTHKHGVEPTLDKAARQKVKQQFADSAVKLWSLGSVCEYHSSDPAVLARQIETSKQFIELAADVGARAVKVRPNNLPKEAGEEKTLEQIGKSLHELGPVAQSAGIEICVEMHGAGTQEPKRMRRIMEVADHKAVGVTWNSNPVDVDKEGSIAKSFHLMRKWIYNVHINELTSGYPYRELFRLLNATGYNRYTMMEIQNLATTDARDVMRFLQYYKALWQAWSEQPKV